MNAERLNLLLVDEPKRSIDELLIVQWALAIHSAKCGVRIWENPVSQNLFEANQPILAHCDVICFNRWLLTRPSSDVRKYFYQIKYRGVELGLYSCYGSAHELDPYSYYLLQAWECWNYGATSSYFWSFTDTGGTYPWNEYMSIRNSYVPFYIDDTSVTTSKQMEAIREGVEDYEYLVMLGERIRAVSDRTSDLGLLDRARQLIQNGPTDVCNAVGVRSFLWSEQKDRSLSEALRLKILDMLIELDGIEQLRY